MNNYEQLMQAASQGDKKAFKDEGVMILNAPSNNESI
jgi:hypothetical protein